MKFEETKTHRRTPPSVRLRRLNLNVKFECSTISRAVTRRRNRCFDTVPLRANRHTERDCFDSRDFRNFKIKTSRTPPEKKFLVLCTDGEEGKFGLVRNENFFGCFFFETSLQKKFFKQIFSKNFSLQTNFSLKICLHKISSKILSKTRRV